MTDVKKTEVQSNAAFFVGDVVKEKDGCGRICIVIGVERFFQYKQSGQHTSSIRYVSVEPNTELPVGDASFLGEDFGYLLGFEFSGSSCDTVYDAADLVLVERGWYWRKAHNEHLYALVRTPSTCPKSIEFMHGNISDVNAAVKARNNVLRKNPYVTLLVKKVVFATQQGECNGY